ncbi:bifunctional RNase H/acid phosphatase [Micromonospora endophytica]|uniref:Bifunctional RNase H/acid phosphatase n=1 Tax=Micromonospora endophytica TaxID=515350 RepID=A0A2W2CKQ9_9ACTN|nr:bifunctional RNase H/acid phosphatase [Micromonospora endophytica]PZG00072.1 bifunctional RNase H/acid phosphatase [Micromonospora endophytica]RIW47054.1 bifunctional RNase H/acid phosphatase [Micromonospora endophytica]BCJ60986.1 bifunctional RNase H/acid phosphatase [Micromonospora endophytica]
MAPRTVLVEADGGARGNPGPAGYGAVVRDSATGAVLAERSEAIGTATNNVAEYRGLIAGLTAAAELGADEVQVKMDSKLVVEQMSGRWQIKHPGLRPLAAEAARLVGRFTAVRFEWIPRDRNTHADALANAAMDAAAAAGVATADVASPRLVEPPRNLSGPQPAGGGAARVAAHAESPGADLTNAPVSWEPRPSFTATRLILVRHGETEYTEQGRYSGRGDIALSPKGQDQVRATATRVATLAPDAAAVISSPLTRCTATAAAIAGALGDVPVRRDDDLIECDFGAWEGRTFADVREHWAGELDAWLASPRVAPPDGESFAEVATRCARVIERVCTAYPGQTVILVSHVSPIKLMLRDALAATDAFLHRLYLDAAGISVFDRWPDGGLAVRTVNDTAHL